MHPRRVDNMCPPFRRIEMNDATWASATDARVSAVPHEPRRVRAWEYPGSTHCLNGQSPVIKRAWCSGFPYLTDGPTPCRNDASTIWTVCSSSHKIAGTRHKCITMAGLLNCDARGTKLLILYSDASRGLDFFFTQVLRYNISAASKSLGPSVSHHMPLFVPAKISSKQNHFKQPSAQQRSVVP